MKRLYITFSYFQFLEALIFVYEKRNYEKSLIVLLKLKTDNTNYEKLMKKLNMSDFIELKILEFGKCMDLYKFLLLNKNKFKKDLIYLPTEFRYQITLFVQILSKQVEILGDGAGLIWDVDRKKILKSEIKYILFKFLFNIKTPYELSKTVNRNFFEQKWKFIIDKYQNLNLRNECWIFGTSIPFVKPYSLEVYSSLSREFFEKGGWQKEEYIKWIDDIGYKMKKNNIICKYYPHPLEIDVKYKYVEDSIKNSSSELLPFEVGYLPKYIFSLSTTAFYYLNLKKYLKNDIKVFVLSQTKKIDEVYKNYGAIIYKPGYTNLKEYL